MKEDSSFLKKRSKKLLSPCARCRRGARQQVKVFCFFFSKKKILPSLACLLLGLSFFSAASAPFLAPYPPTRIDLRQRLLPPAWPQPGRPAHLLGTDNVGRDMLSRIIWGARISLAVGLSAALLGAVAGSVLGLCAGFFGGAVDAAISWLINVQLAFPFTLFAIFLLAVFGGGFLPVVGVLALATWVNFARIVRSQTLSLRAQDFVTAAHAVGVGAPRILRRYIFPAVLPSIVVVASFSAAQAILTEAALSFLGVGVDPTIPSWGAMLNLGRNYLQTAWWMATFPGIAIALTVLGANLMGDWLGTRLDPRAR
jgi:peptide/nickel transport system permease protein